MDRQPDPTQHSDLTWGWSRANIIACTALGLIVLGLILFQWLGRTHHLGSDITPEPDLVESASAKIDPNTASAAELAAIPSIGPALADRIVSHRRQFRSQNPPNARPFSTLDDLQNVKGIGPKTAEKMRPYLTFKNPPPP